MTIKDLFKELIVGFAILPMLIAGGVSATFTAHSIGSFTPSVGDSSFSVSVLSLGEVYTENGSLENFVFAPRNDLLFYRNIDSNPILLLPNCYSNRYGGELKYYYFCDEIPDSNFNGMTNCSSFESINYNYLSSFMGTITSNDNWAYDYHLGQYGFNLCFSSKSESKSLCFGSQSSVYNDWCSMWQSDLTCSNGYCSYTSPFSGSEYTNLTYTFDTIPLEVIGFAPGTSDKPSYSIGQNYYTNGQIVEGYEYLGLDIGYCYGGFPIDDIFEPNQTIEDFTGYKFGVGATVWDLYDLYSGAYSTPKQFFQQMLQAYMNGQINRFKTEPKALVMFVQQFVSGRDRGRLNVGFYDIWDYCNLKFDNVDLNAQYTGNNKTPINGYNQKKVSDSNIGGFQFTGDNAFNIIVGTGGSGNITASEFFGNLTSRFQNGLGSIDDTFPSGVIPTYILMFMFALIFIRLISH